MNLGQMSINKLHNVRVFEPSRNKAISSSCTTVSQIFRPQLYHKLTIWSKNTALNLFCLSFYFYSHQHSHTMFKRLQSKSWRETILKTALCFTKVRLDLYTTINATLKNSALLHFVWEVQSRVYLLVHSPNASTGRTRTKTRTVLSPVARTQTLAPSPTASLLSRKL